MIEIQDIRKVKYTNEYGYDAYREEIKINGRWRKPKWVSSRSVFLVKKGDKSFVIKVSNETDQNQDEWKLLNKLKPEDKKYFPKALHYGKFKKYDFIIQSYVKVNRKREPSDKHVTKILELTKKYKLTDLCEDCCSHSLSNWGIKNNGHVAILDAGI